MDTNLGEKGSDFSASSIKTAILSNKPLWLLGACLGGISFIEYTYFDGLPSFLFETFDTTIVKAGISALEPAWLIAYVALAV